MFMNVGQSFSVLLCYLELQCSKSAIRVSHSKRNITRTTCITHNLALSMSDKNTLLYVIIQYLRTRPTPLK